jgi:hypothetical protein
MSRTGSLDYRGLRWTRIANPVGGSVDRVLVTASDHKRACGPRYADADDCLPCIAMRDWMLAQKKARKAGLQPVDGIPWEVHDKEPEAAYEIALESFKANLLPNDAPQDTP